MKQLSHDQDEYDGDWTKHIRFALWWVGKRARHARHRFGKAEVTQAALRGLYMASLRYIPRRHGRGRRKFIAYAKHWIYGEISRLYRHENRLRWRRPWRGAMARPVYLFSELGPKFVRGRASAFAYEAPREDTEVVFFAESLLRLIRARKRQFEMIRRRFGIGYEHPVSARELAREHGVTDDCVQQIIAKGLRLIAERCLVKLEAGRL